MAVRIAWLNWRDTSHPEGGGSEVFLEQIASRLVSRGHDVTIVCAHHDQAPDGEIREGIRFRRLGSKLGVYGQARRLLRSGELGPLDVVVDTQNGVPFFSTFATTAPVVVLVHHVHREQWPVIYDPVRQRAGWWLESRVAPWVYRRQPYVAVSSTTRNELAGLGVDPARITVVHNGVSAREAGPIAPERVSTRPTVTVLGRLVPHKQVEHVLQAARVLRQRIPDLQVNVVGDGWWAPHLHTVSRDLGVDDVVTFTGFVDDGSRDRLLRESWVLALPSLKEGWGLVVMEAAARGVPAVAYAQAGGVSESIQHDRTGLLVGPGYDVEAFTRTLGQLLTDRAKRDELGIRAHQRADQFDWEASTDAFEEVLERAITRPTRVRRSGRGRPATQAR